MRKILLMSLFYFTILPSIAAIDWAPLDNSNVNFYDKNFQKISNGIYSITLKRSIKNDDLIYVGELDCRNEQIRYQAGILADNIKNETKEIIPMDYTWGSIMPGLGQKAYLKICK